MSANNQHQGFNMKGMSARAFGSQSFHTDIPLTPTQRQAIQVIRDERDVLEENQPTTVDITADCINAARAEVERDEADAVPLTVIGKTLALLDAIADGGYASVGLFSEVHSEIAFRTWASVRGFTIMESRNEAGALIRLHLETYRWSVTMYVSTAPGVQS